MDNFMNFTNAADSREKH